MGCNMATVSKHCPGNLVVDCHKGTSVPPGMAVRSNVCAKRNSRCAVLTANCSLAVQQPMASAQHALTRPSQVLPRQAPTALVGKSPQSEVLVRLSINYKCDFGTRLALIGSQQGWQTAASTPMTWSNGDVWTADVGLPIGADIEYKYIVVDGSGAVIRWQEGSNNRLSARTAGVELHVADSWAQDRRQVHEAPVATAHANNSSHSSSSSHHHQQAPAAAQSNSNHSNTDSLQNNITRFSRPAALRNISKTSVEDAAASVVAKQQKPISQVRRSARVLTPKKQTTQSSQHTSVQQQVQQQLQDLRPPRLVNTLEKLLPLLQTELASALDALNRSSPAQDAATRGLLAEGQAVLGMLKQQAASGTHSMPGTPAGDVQQATIAVNPHASVASGLKHPSSRTSDVRVRSQGSRSPGSSPGSSLASASEDEIAAALLSDDCEEACYCLVDAICNCMASGGTHQECSEVHFDQHPACNAAGFAAEAFEVDDSRGSSLVMSSISDSASAAGTPDMTQAADELVTAEQLVSQAALAVPAAQETAAASVRSNDDVELRAAAFADVQRAMDQSAALLDCLADPSHPMMLQADRQVAAAKRQLGQLLPA